MDRLAASPNPAQAFAATVRFGFDADALDDFVLLAEAAAVRVVEVPALRRRADTGLAGRESGVTSSER